jgi:hypothetical protein
MKTQFQVLSCIALAALLAGCATAPPPGGAPVSGYYVGDRARVTFDEVVVSLPLRGVSAPYQNLHLSFGAVINVRKTAWGTTTYELQDIIRRVGRRITARLSEVLSGLGEQSLGDTAALRKRVLTEAQPMIDEALRQWEHGADFQVDIVVESLYWTDASVGRLGRSGGSWWD